MYIMLKIKILTLQKQILFHLHNAILKLFLKKVFIWENHVETTDSYMLWTNVKILW